MEVVCQQMVPHALPCSTHSGRITVGLVPGPTKLPSSHIQMASTDLPLAQGNKRSITTIDAHHGVRVSQPKLASNRWRHDKQQQQVSVTETSVSNEPLHKTQIFHMQYVLQTYLTVSADSVKALIQQEQALLRLECRPVHMGKQESMHGGSLLVRQSFPCAVTAYHC